MSRSSANQNLYTVRFGDTLWLIARLFNTTIQEIASVNPGLDVNNLEIGQNILIPDKFNQIPILPSVGGISEAELALSNRMRLLWEQHVYWTRMVILSMVFGLPDTQVVTNRLPRNPKDFEATLGRFYGKDIAAKFAELLTSHLTIAAELVSAAKAGDSTAAADAEKRWYENADQIAAFLGSINPYWSVQLWQKMLYDHLAMTKTEAVNILSQEYEDSVSVFENIEQQALNMADMMTQGIVKQFPQYFR